MPDGSLSESSPPPIDVIEFEFESDDDDEHDLHRVSSLSSPMLTPKPKTSLDRLLDNIENFWPRASITPNTTFLLESSENMSSIMYQANGDEIDELSVISDPLEILLLDLGIKQEDKQHAPLVTPPSFVVFHVESQHVDNLDPESSLLIPTLGRPLHNADRQPITVATCSTTQQLLRHGSSILN
jgi:hypothetical protein